jgi:hypothetical protein
MNINTIEATCDFANTVAIAEHMKANRKVEAEIVTSEATHNETKSLQGVGKVHISKEFTGGKLRKSEVHFIPTLGGIALKGTYRPVGCVSSEFFYRGVVALHGEGVEAGIGQLVLLLDYFADEFDWEVNYPLRTDMSTVTNLFPAVSLISDKANEVFGAELALHINNMTELARQARLNHAYKARKEANLKAMRRLPAGAILISSGCGWKQVFCISDKPTGNTKRSLTVITQKTLYTPEPREFNKRHLESLELLCGQNVGAMAEDHGLTSHEIVAAIASGDALVAKEPDLAPVSR